MKKFLLSLILMVFAGYASAQSFSGVPAGTHDVKGDLNEDGELKFVFHVSNNTANAITLQCDRVILEKTHDEASNSVCFGDDCFAPFSDKTPAIIPANSEIEFSAHFIPAGTYDDDWNFYPFEGCAMTVQYSFYVNGEDAEPAVVTINFEYTTLSVEDYTDARIFSNAYPNPAKNMVSFDYDMPVNAKTASVAIYNMMGQEVIRQNLNIGGSRLNISVSDLTDGVYFYSLIINNQAVKTNKLVVSK